MFFWAVFLGTRQHFNLEDALQPLVVFLEFQKSGTEELIALISSVSEVESYIRAVGISKSYMHHQSLFIDICDIGGNKQISSIKSIIF